MVEIMLDGTALPALPEQIGVMQESGNTTVSLLDFGEVTLRRKGGGRVFTFSADLPPVPAAPMPPAGYLSHFRKLLSGAEVVPFTVRGTAEEVSTNVTLEQLTSFEAGGDVGTVHYTLVLREYRALPDAQAQTESTLVRRHTLKEGETLWAVAMRYYGDGDMVKAICEANGIRNPYLVQAGQVLILPGGAR